MHWTFFSDVIRGLAFLFMLYERLDALPDVLRLVRRGVIAAAPGRAAASPIEGRIDAARGRRVLPIAAAIDHVCDFVCGP